MSYYDSKEWRILRSHALKRDSYACQSCGYEQGGNRGSLQVHHIIPRKQGGPDHLENLVSLCSKCHGRYEGRDENPRNPEGKTIDDEIDSLTQDTLLRLVEEELSSGVDNLYRNYIIENPFICSNCHEHKYSMSSIYYNIETTGQDIRNITSDVCMGDSSVDDYPPIDKSLLCSDCQVLDRSWPSKKAIGKKELLEEAQGIERFFENSPINFNSEMFSDCVYVLKGNSKMQWRNRDILRYATNYAIRFSF